jgi:ABC-type multidrug transport system ATPase subunit
MLELHGVSLTGGEQWLLRGITARFNHGLHAIVGPSGCGKTMLLNVIAGIRRPDEGTVRWAGRDLEEHDLAPHEIGYVPQFGIAFDLLRVDESIDIALRLRAGGLSSQERENRTQTVLSTVGLAEIADRRVGVLSGGQKRRLALALELLIEPVLLLCDEVTTGLDPKSESEIVHLLHEISRFAGRTVLTVTHSLRHLDLYDGVAVMYQGRLIYHGAPDSLTQYFNIENPEQLFPALAARTADEWHAQWTNVGSEIPETTEAISAERGDDALMSHPDFVTQFFTVLRRRWLLFFRNRGQIALQLALLFGFPFLVVIFAWDGLPQIQNLRSIPQNALQQLLETAAFTLRSSRIASLVSGLVMFQVILLTLMGSNNAAREIAGERAIFEKEKFSGLRPSSYIASKVAFLGVIIVAQSAWMGIFVNLICRFPGDLLAQIGVLTLANAAMTFISLAISSLTRSPENASLLSVYLVGFQLPLSGAVLALPHLIGLTTRPFIAAFWGWSGYLQTMRETRFYDVVQTMTQTDLAPYGLCVWVLVMHVVGGILVACLGAQHSRWH